MAFPPTPTLSALREETDAVQALLNLTADAVDDLAEGVTVDNAAVRRSACAISGTAKGPKVAVTK